MVEPFVLVAVAVLVMILLAAVVPLLVFLKILISDTALTSTWNQDVKFFITKTTVIRIYTTLLIATLHILTNTKLKGTRLLPRVRISLEVVHEVLPSASDNYQRVH